MGEVVALFISKALAKVVHTDPNTASVFVLTQRKCRIRTKYCHGVPFLAVQDDLQIPCKWQSRSVTALSLEVE